MANAHIEQSKSFGDVHELHITLYTSEVYKLTSEKVRKEKEKEKYIQGIQ
jgi:hypothetical protein